MEINLDIQNILVLKKMYELKNVRQVSEALGKTPGAISKNLTKLKAQLNDPLFVQTKAGFEPTEFVEANMAHFDAILNTVESIGQTSFSPEKLEGKIQIYANTLFWDRYGAQFYLALAQDAPKARFSFLLWGVNPRNRIIDGEKSVAIHAYDESLPQAIYQKHLAKDCAVFFVREGHPAQAWQDLISYPMVILKTPGYNDHKYRMLERLKNIGVEITPKLEVEHTVTSHKTVLNSDHYGLTMLDNVPEGCRCIFPPLEDGFDVQYVVSCRRSQQKDPCVQWLFNTVSRVVSKEA